VQHLLGVGHLHRVAVIARALASGGFDVMLVSGGMPDPTLSGLEKIRFEQLPPTRAADATFRKLLDEKGGVIDDAWRAMRTQKLIALADDFRPDAVLTELFPFARRPMRFELLPLLAHLQQMQPRPLVYSSVRDILVDRTKPERDKDAVGWLKQYYDGAFVHGDQGLIRFERTFELAKTIPELLHYTGYIVERAHLPSTETGRGEVLVSAGGGAVGMPLFRCALAARSLSDASDLPWRFFVSPLEGEAAFAELRGLAGAALGRGITIDTARPDFPAMLGHCALSISKAGYNTIMETLSAGCRAIAVPFAGGEETEQALRANLLAERGLMQVVREAELTPEKLAEAIGRALRLPRPADTPAFGSVDLEGAAHTVALLKGFLARLGNGG